VGVLLVNWRVYGVLDMISERIKYHVGRCLDIEARIGASQDIIQEMYCFGDINCYYVVGKQFSHDFCSVQADKLKANDDNKFKRRHHVVYPDHMHDDIEDYGSIVPCISAVQSIKVKNDNRKLRFV
jgi:hypothetical protein